MQTKQDERVRGARGSASGFTLIEVLLVVAILGILATVVVVNFGGQSEKAKKSATKASIAAICTAIQSYEVQLGKYPTSLRDLTVDSDAMRAPLDRVPTDSWGAEFQYTDKGHGRFEVRSAGPDGQFGSEDDLTN